MNRLDMINPVKRNAAVANEAAASARALFDDVRDEHADLAGRDLLDEIEIAHADDGGFQFLAEDLACSLGLDVTDADLNLADSVFHRTVRDLVRTHAPDPDDDAGEDLVDCAPER